MAYGTVTVVFMVIAVVACVVAIAFAGTYALNRTVDRNGG